MDEKPCQWVPIMIKRWWVPHWLYGMFAWDSNIWGLKNAATMQPWRWLFHREVTEFERKRLSRPVVHEGESE